MPKPPGKTEIPRVFPALHGSTQQGRGHDQAGERFSGHIFFFLLRRAQSAKNELFKNWIIFGIWAKTATTPTGLAPSSPNPGGKSIPPSKKWSLMMTAHTWRRGFLCSMVYCSQVKKPQNSTSIQKQSFRKIRVFFVVCEKILEVLFK